MNRPTFHKMFHQSEIRKAGCSISTKTNAEMNERRQMNKQTGKLDIILSKYRHPERGKGKNYESLDVSQMKGKQSNVHAMQCLLLGELFHFLLKSKIVC